MKLTMAMFRQLIREACHAALADPEDEELEEADHVRGSGGTGGAEYYISCTSIPRRNITQGNTNNNVFITITIAIPASPNRATKPITHLVPFNEEAIRGRQVSDVQTCSVNNNILVIPQGSACSGPGPWRRRRGCRRPGPRRARGRALAEPRRCRGGP